MFSAFSIIYGITLALRHTLKNTLASQVRITTVNYGLKRITCWSFHPLRVLYDSAHGTNSRLKSVILRRFLLTKQDCVNIWHGSTPQLCTSLFRYIPIYIYIYKWLYKGTILGIYYLMFVLIYESKLLAPLAHYFLLSRLFYSIICLPLLAAARAWCDGHKRRL